MRYCENCHLVCEGEVCPFCGKRARRAPEDGDYCYLTTLSSPWAEAMQEALAQAGIDCLAKPGRSVLYSVAFGQTHGDQELFVPWGKLQSAAELQKSLFESETAPEEPEE